MRSRLILRPQQNIYLNGYSLMMSYCESFALFGRSEHRYRNSQNRRASKPRAAGALEGCTEVRVTHFARDSQCVVDCIHDSAAWEGQTAKHRKCVHFQEEETWPLLDLRHRLHLTPEFQCGSEAETVRQESWLLPVVVAVIYVSYFSQRVLAWKHVSRRNIATLWVVCGFNARGKSNMLFNVCALICVWRRQLYIILKWCSLPSHA